MARITISSAVFCWLLALAPTGDAQIVRVGPGGAVSVRAPFVRVEVGPFGGTYVRAPFTSVRTPGYRGRVRYNRYPPAPYDRPGVAPLPAPFGNAERDAERDIAQMSLPELQSLLVARWNALQQDLSRFPNGASWQRHLQLPGGMLREHADPLAAANPEPLEVENVLSRYDRVGNGYEYRAISRLANFQATRQVLTVYLERLVEASVDMPPPPAPEEMLPPPPAPVETPPPPAPEEVPPPLPVPSQP